ncbi:MAG: S8 family serine peptidase [Propionibacteriaceae bacterium]
MARKPLIALGAASTLVAGFVLPAVAANPTTAPVVESTNSFIVTYDTDMSAQPERLESANVQASRQGTSVSTSLPIAPNAEEIQLDRTLSPEDAAKYIQALKSQPGVAGVSVNSLQTHQYVPNDTRYGEQWDMKGGTGFNLESVRDIATGRGVNVAVIDTGITRHSDLNGNILPGYDMVSDSVRSRDGDGADPDPSDEGDWNLPKECSKDDPGSNSSWHGTHVAGTIAAITNNNQGVASVASEAKVVPVRVLGKCGGSTADIVRGMRWAAGLDVPGIPRNPNPAKVLNMSLGGRGTCSSIQQTTIDQINAAGGTVVVAAGNSNADAANFNPASCRGVITIGSTGPSGKRAYYSNYGWRVDVSAPGGDTSLRKEDGILSTINTGKTTPGGEGYAFYQGTSMAAPHIAGLVALFYQLDPTMNSTKALAALKAGARQINCPEGCGAGLVDSQAAINSIRGNNPNPRPTVAPTTVRPTVAPTTVRPTVAPTTVAPSAGNAFINGTFEDGQTGWSGNTEVIRSGNLTHTGKGSAQFLGTAKGRVEQLNQIVTVPRNGKLTYWVKVNTAETSSVVRDRLQVEIRQKSGSFFKTVDTITNRDATGDWVQRTIDLAGWDGTTFQIRFTASEDSSAATTFYLDDVVLAQG